MKKITAFFLLLMLSSLGLSAQDDPRIARAKTPLSQVQALTMPLLDNEALLAAELQRRGPGIAPKFAETFEVDINPLSHGSWEYLPGNKAVWRLRIQSAGAKSLNLGFSRYAMPEGGTLVLYSPDYAHIMGPFTPADNEAHEQLWTPILPGDELVVEVQVPAHSQPALQLHLKHVNHDFLGFGSLLSGSCNLDVICGEADGWALVDNYRDIIQSVAVIGLNGGTFCTGFLVNNARQDCTPFFMTADHCGINAGNAASLVAYWNFQNSTCRQPNTPQSGAPGNGQLNDFNTGSFFRSGWNDADFTLVELDDPVSETADAFFAGWNAGNQSPPDTAICIHHPGTDEKRISFEFNSPVISDIGGNPNPSGNFVKIPDWDIGTTEGGSSGSPLFNKDKQVVGQLYGGLAACSNNDYDVFGWFHRSWSGGGSPSTRLKDWLDPDNSGITSIGGRSQLQCNFFVEAQPANVSLCAPQDAVFTVSVSGSFTGEVALSLDGLPDSLTVAFENDTLPPGGSTILTLGNTGAVAAGEYTLQLSGTDGTETGNSLISLVLVSDVPDTIQLNFPADGSNGINLSPQFTWQPVPNASYSIEIAGDEGFTNILESAANLGENSYQPGIALQVLTTYFWRVKAENTCGENDWSPPFSFTTGAILCSSLASTNVPKPISPNGTPAVTSTLVVNENGNIDDVNVTNLTINHTWVGDLRVELTSPSGTTVSLFSNPSGGDCPGDNMQVGFDDESGNDYGLFDGMCEAGPLAISGVFQPLNPLSAFEGEMAAGTWTLTVYDDANQDGGTLVSWGLDLCTVIPDDFSVIPAGNTFQSCLQDAISFSLITGTAFDASAGVSFEAEGLPPGAGAVFNPNPAQPGETVDVTISGATATGIYDFIITATDGSNSGSASATWTLNGPPAIPTPLAPAPNAVNVPLNAAFQWAASGASSYHLRVATDPAMSNVVFSATPSNTSVSANQLEPCTGYFWTVSAQGQCGTSDNSVPQSFTTLDDLAFSIPAAAVSLCPVATASATLSIGDCFEAGGVSLEANGLPAGITLGFSPNPAPPGSTVTIQITTDGPLLSGALPLTVLGSDGVNSVSATLNLFIQQPAAAPQMLQPADGASGVATINTFFQWQPVAGASSYRFQLSDDVDFTNLIWDDVMNPSLSSFNLPIPLGALTTYCWRVTAFNSCGGTTPAAFCFATDTGVSTFEAAGLEVRIQPNPSSGRAFVLLSSPATMPVDIHAFSEYGQLLFERRLTPGQTATELDLSGYPAGTYLLKLIAEKAVLSEKIIIIK